MKKLLLTILILVPLAAVATHFYLTGKLESQVEEIASQTSMFGTLEWDDVSIHPRGDASITGLRFAPHMTSDQLRIDRVSVTAPNYIALIRSTAELEDGRLPEQLGLSLRGIRIPLTGSGINMIEAEFASGLPFEAAGCGTRTGFSAGDLVAMNFRELDFSLDLNYQLVGGGEAMNLRASTETREMSALDLDMKVHLGSGSRDIDLVARAWSMARLIEAEIDYRNLGFREAVTSFCAARSGMDRARYREHHLRQWIEAWSREGLTPSEDMIMAYREFLHDPQSVRITLRPERQLPLSSFTRLSREELFEQLGPSVSINGQEPRVLDFRPAPTTALAGAETESESGAGNESTDETAPDAESGADQSDIPERNRRSAWTRISFDEAFDHIGSPIRLTTSNDERVRGRLTSIDNGLLHVRIQGVGGFYVRPYSRTQVGDIEVRQR